METKHSLPQWQHLREAFTAEKIDEIIVEEERHLKSLAEIKTSEDPLTSEGNVMFAPLVENYACSENDLY